MNRNKVRVLTEGPVWKSLLIFFLPIAAGTCLQQLYNAVDGVIVGRFVGTVALAAVGGSAAMIINVLIGFFVSVTSGASVVIAQIFGSGRREDVQKVTGNALAVFGLMGVVLAVFGLVGAEWMLRLLKTPENTIEASLLYLRIYFIGVPVVLLLNMESNLLRAVGDSFSPFVFMVVGCITNIVLDFVFVVCFHWGVAGVAIATVAAQMLNMALLTRKLLTTEECYRLQLRNLKLNGRYLRNMMRLGIPSGLQASMFNVSNTIIQVGINTLGTVVVASWAMTSKTDGLYWAVSNALGAAITTFVGQNIGAGRTDRVKACLKEGMILSLSMTVVLSVGLMVAARPLLRILTEDTDVIETTYQIMWYLVPYYFVWTLVEVFSSTLRGAGDSVRPVIIIGLGICLFRIIWVMTVFAWLGTLPSLCWCYPISWVITGVSLVIYARRSDWLTIAARNHMNA